jgi:hypothetical protein
VELMLAGLSTCESTREGIEEAVWEACGKAGGRASGAASSLVWDPRCSYLSLAPAINCLDVYLHGNPLRGVGVQARVHDLVPPDYHDFLKKGGHLLGLLLGARHDQLVVGEVVLVTASRQLL